MKKAAIDLGTNTCLLLILDSNGEILHDESNIVRLGEGLFDTGIFSIEAMNRTSIVLKEYVNTCKKFDIDLSKVKAVATESARKSKNANEFFLEIRSSLGIQFNILSGQEEAEASFVGALGPKNKIDPDHLCVLDIGGGSTELVFKNDQQLQSVSLPLGAGKITDLFLKVGKPRGKVEDVAEKKSGVEIAANADTIADIVTDQQYWDAQDYIDSILNEQLVKKDYLGKNIVAVAGTATTLVQIKLSLSKFDSKQIDGCALTIGDVHRMCGDLKWRSLAEKENIVGLDPKRAAVILGGTMILHRVMTFLEVDQISVSTRGLRFGVLNSST